ncbi:MAG TPA: hypothetical protein VFY12_07460 [Arenimonas sp.]|nr:hypothetical protein [Arenimonas sp.]
MRLNRVLIATLVLATVGGAYWHRSQNPGQAAPTATSALDTSSPISPDDGAIAAAPALPPAAAAATPSLETTSESGFGPLPALDVPLADAMATLEHRAAAGDAAAACRLAAELARCDQLRFRLTDTQRRLDWEQQRIAQRPERSGNNDAFKRHLDSLTRSSERLITESQHCSGVAPADPGRIAQLWRTAALTGHGPSLRHYASGNAFRMRDTLRNLDALRRYQQEAESLALRAARGGDVMLQFTLANAYAAGDEQGGRYLLAQSVQPDPARALAIFLHLQRALPDSGVANQPRIADLLSRRISQLRSELSAADTARAETEALALQQDWARADWPDSLDQRMLEAGATPAASRESCDDGKFASE